MKAWRNKQNQEKFRESLRGELWTALIDKSITITQFNERYRDLSKARIGKRLRDSFPRILPAPSFLVQALFINAGISKGA